MLEYAPPVMLGLTGWHASTVRRLGEVLTLLLKSGSSQGASATPLDFFRTLATVTELCLIVQGCESDTPSWLLDGQRCMELLALEGAAQAELVEILFTPFQAEGRRLRYTRLLEMRGLPEALAAAPEPTLHAARALKSSDRAHCIKLLQRSELGTQEEFGRFLVASVLQDPKPAAYTAAKALSDVPRARAMLEKQLHPELPAEVHRRMSWGLRRLRLLEHAQADTCRDGSGYLSITGDWLAIPPPEPLPPDTPVPAGFADALRAALKEAGAEARRASGESQGQHEPGRRPNNGALFSSDAIGDLLHVMSGALAPATATENVERYLTDPTEAPARHWSAAALYARRLETLLSSPGVTLHHLARLFALYLKQRDATLAELLSDTAAPVPAVLRLRAHAAADLRPVLQGCQAAGVETGELLTELLRWHDPGARRSQALLWQVIGEHLTVFDEALARPPAVSGHKLLRALQLLAALPAVPARYGPILLDLATRGSVEWAAPARALLAAAPDIPELILSLLESPHQEQRIAAACWARERGDREAIAALRAALAREKAQSVRAELLTSLVALGDWEHLCDERQLHEARERLANTQTRLDRCLPLHGLPPLAWVNGRPVPPELARWWVVRAEQLKQPRADPLLQAVLDRLEPASAAQLAWQALSRFVLYDTLLAGKTLARFHFNCEQAVARLTQCARRDYADSAVEHRGILALLPWADPSDTAALVGTYLRFHTGRRKQCRTLLDALAVNPAPAILQLLHEVATQHRAPRLRAHAAWLCQIIATQRGWTLQELADHAAPTGGLNERGVLKLPYGDGAYTAELGADLRPMLRNAQRKTVRRLVVHGEHAAAAEQRWALFRKQLPEIVEKQTQRLKEAMMSGRSWQAANFIELLRHPILGRLCQLLIFAGVDRYGTRLTFRPVEDGRCISAASDPVDIMGCCRIRVAHRVLMDEPEVSAWTQHIEDYKLVPLFTQLY